MNKTYQKQNNDKGRKYNKLFGNTRSESLISITRLQRIATSMALSFSDVKSAISCQTLFAGQQVCRFLDLPAFTVNAVPQSSIPSVIHHFLVFSYFRLTPARGLFKVLQNIYFRTSALVNSLRHFLPAIFIPKHFCHVPRTNVLIYCFW